MELKWEFIIGWILVTILFSVMLNITSQTTTTDSAVELGEVIGTAAMSFLILWWVQKTFDKKKGKAIVKKSIKKRQSTIFKLLGWLSFSLGIVSVIPIGLGVPAISVFFWAVILFYIAYKTLYKKENLGRWESVFVSILFAVWIFFFIGGFLSVFL